MKHQPITSRTIPVLLIFLLSLTLIISVIATDDRAYSAPPTGFLTGNGILLEANTFLPVFQFLPPEVTADSSVNLALNFAAIGEQPAQQDQYLDHTRFSILNEASNAMLEQYGATGGFYAFNASEAFSEEVRGPVDPVMAQSWTCQFLFFRQLFPDSNLISTPPTNQCSVDFNTNPYETSLIFAAAADSDGNATGPEEVIGVVVRVPMNLNTGAFSQVPTVPLGGAGGHLSLLFRTTDFNQAAYNTAFSLAEDVPGLGAVAMPFHSRQLTYLDNFPMRDPAEIVNEVEQSLFDAYPSASSINIPPPALLYMVGDAAQRQKILEPMWEFSNIEIEEGGERIVLRSLVKPALIPGVGGFGPDVAIIDPANGSQFIPNTAVTLTGSISGGTAPYTYTWRINDGTLLASGTSATGGNIQVTTDALPVVSHAGYPADVVILLEAEDDTGATRQAILNLYPAVAPSIYLPVLLGQAAQTPQATTNLTTPAAPQIASTTFRFGVHAGSDYPPYGPSDNDLAGVIPDATGFRTGMLNYGWVSTYNWWNASAWERDWRDCSLGGGDCTFGVDRVDFAYFAGHSGPGGLSMPSSVDSSWFAAENARYSTLRWAGFASCQALRAQWTPASEAPIRRWFGAFQGAHMLLGYNSDMRDVAFGPRLVDNMRMPTFLGIPFPWAQRSIREAWVQTAFQMNAGQPAYLYAKGTNGVNPVNDKLPRPGDPLPPRPFPVASYHWVWWNE